jgi:ABC-type transport system involved in multi-copper enzyme maturation permease subunit
MLIVNLQVEIIKIVKRPMTWVLVAILAALIVTLNVSMYTTAIRSDFAENRPAEVQEAVWASLCWPTAFSDLLESAAGHQLGGLVLAILVGSVVAQEYTWRSVHLWLGRGLSRMSFLGSKFMALAVVCLMFTLVPVLIGGPLTAWFTVQRAGTLSLSEVPAGGLVVGILRTAYTILPYIALMLLVAVLTRSAAASIGVGLAYALLAEQILGELLALAGGFWADLSRYLPGGLAGALLRLNRTAFGMESGIYGGGSGQVLGPWAAATGVALYTAVFLGAALWAFARQDLTE